MRNYKHIDKYLDLLEQDIYDQPEDSGHTQLAQEAIQEFMSIIGNVGSILDAGCGTGFCQAFFEKYCQSYSGICLGDDYRSGLISGRNVMLCDFTFTPYKSESFDVVFSRHSLEHSPMPLLTLMEWHRISRRYACLVLPAPEHWRYGGRNHYFVLNRHQWKALFDASGWNVTYENVKRFKMAVEPEKPDVAIEYWFILEKKQENENG